MRIERYFDTAVKIVTSFFKTDAGSDSGFSRPPSKSSFKDIDSVELPVEVMKEAAEKMKVKRADGSFRDGFVNRKVIKKVAPWKKGKRNAGNDTNT